MSNVEVLVGRCLRKTQVVGIQEAESYLMAQRLRYGDGEDSYLQNRCLANLISTLTPQSHFDIFNDLVSSTKNSAVREQEKNKSVFDLFSDQEGKLQRTVLLTAESADSTEVCTCKRTNRLRDAMRTFGKSICCAQSLLVAGGKSEGQPQRTLILLKFCQK